MKKHTFRYTTALLLLCAFFIGCEKEEPVQQPVQEFAKVSPVDMPAYFEVGKSYTINVVYTLPSSCYKAYGLGIERQGNSPEGLRNIFITGVATYDPEVSCEERDIDLEVEDSFYISIDQEQPYTLYFWSGIDENHEHIFTEIQVPVNSPESE